MVFGWGPFAGVVNTALVGKLSSLTMFHAVFPGLSCKAMTSFYPLAYIFMSPRLKNGVLAMVGMVSVKQE